MARSVAIIDTTLRDGQQSLWATRMTTAMMLGVAEDLDRAGYYLIEVSAPVNFDACIRYLKENPWERLRLMSRRMPRTPVQAGLRSRNFLSFEVVHEDLMELACKLLHANGARRIFNFDGLHDMDNLRPGMEACRRLGVSTCLGVVYTISPVHTDQYYARKAQEMLALGADTLRLKDPSGLLTVDRARTLVPALKRVAGDRLLEVHTHSLTGLAPLVLLESVACGADAVSTTIPPLAEGASHPSVLDLAENLKLLGYDVPLDLGAVRHASSYLSAVAQNEGLPTGQIAHYDLFHYQHQIPGGVISNLRSQLRDAGMEHKLRAVLEEIPRVREELGWPIMVSPYSQFVAVQAALNVVHGERYRVVLDEIAKWVYGYYGRLEAPVDPEAMDRITGNASKRISPRRPPLEPALPGLRKAYPGASDEELLLRAFFKGTQVDDMLAAQPMNLVYEFRRDLVGLVRHLISVAETGHLVFSTAGLELSWQR